MVLLTVAQVSLLASADEEYYDYYDYDYDEDTYYTENEYSNDDSDDTTYNNSYLSGYSEQEDNSENSDILSVYETEAISADGADYILGDVTGDGKLSPIDSLIVLRYVCGRESLTELQKELGDWMRVAVGVNESRNIRVCRFADTMRNVAVTDGDKVEAHVKFGWTVDAWPVNDLVPYVDAVTDAEAKALADEYYDTYELVLDGRDPEEFRRHVEVQAAQEIGIERFLEEHNYNAFSDHFGDLGGLKQLPSLAIQRLMQKGYGFGPEGDWKTPAMVRLMKVMTAGMKDAKGSALMEDYTYNLVKGKEGILESHMSEVDPSVADGRIAIRATPLSMGDREDPARLIFTGKTGPAIATSLVDLGNRFRLIIQDVDCKPVEKPMPMLPTGTVFWEPRPNLKVGTAAWIYAGGAHHTAFSYDLTADQMVDWAEAMGIEPVVIDANTNLRDFQRDLKLGEVYYR